MRIVAKIELKGNRQKKIVKVSDPYKQDYSWKYIYTINIL